jgi:hypothetical protein
MFIIIVFLSFTILTTNIQMCNYKENLLQEERMFCVPNVNVIRKVEGSL